MLEVRSRHHLWSGSVRLLTDKDERREKELRVSHSKVGLIERQGGIQQNGSRAGKLQVRQEGQLKATDPFF